MEIYKLLIGGALVDGDRPLDVLNPATEQVLATAPCASEAQLDQAVAAAKATFPARSRAHGTIIASGEIEDRPGYFIRPTIVRDIEDGTRLVDEEQFGPVLPLIRFTDSEDTLARANASPLGLGGSIWSADSDLAYDLADRMEAGTVWTNKHLDFGPHVPFGGAKQSGIGVEFAQEGLQAFARPHAINAAK